MGLFARRKQPAVPAPPPPQTTTMMYPPPLPNSPPPSYALLAPHGGSIPGSYLPQRPQHQQIAYPQDEGFLSVEDFNAIQRAIDQDEVIDQFSNIITNIDEEKWNENDDDDFSIVIPEEPNEPEYHFSETSRAIGPSRNPRERRRPDQPRVQKVTIWSKVSFYSNSRLPAELPPLRVYIPTWPLICLAAQYSANAYKAPASSKEREAFVSAGPTFDSKAMVMKSVPCDEKKTIVFAIRGTSTLSLRNWNVNLHTAPVSPEGFLEDEGNLCHSGFLRVAKALIKPIAMRLRTLLEENPSRASCNLLITGHSAGGAVAALLYSHMTSTKASTESELSILTGCFKRVHCVTFGAPPVTLLPLSKPTSKRFIKSFFFSFINEGDPVVRAEKAYIRSLVDLLSSPLPTAPSQAQKRTVTAKKSLSRLQNSVSKLDLSLSKLDLTNPYAQNTGTLNPLKNKHSRINFSQPNVSLTPGPPPAHSPARSGRMWPVPQATLSNAGRLVVLRVPPQTSYTVRKGPNLQRTTSVRWEKDHLSKVTAHIVTDEQLRQVIFGDPAMHAMETYLRRVDMLALKAVTGRS